MQSLKTILMSGVAAISLAATPALAQEATESAGDEQMTQSSRSYDETYGGDFAAWGDQTVDELVGTAVVNDNGETIGEIDDFGLAQDQLVAIVGVGGFLGIGEHSVAIPIDQLSTEGDQVLLSGVTREDLEAMPKYDSAESQTFASDQTLRSGYETGPAEAPSTEMAEGATAEQPAEGEATEMAEGDTAEQPAEGEATEMAEGDTAEQPAEGETTEMAEGDTAEQPAEGEATEMAEADTAEQPAEGEATEMAEGGVTGESTTGENAEMAGTEAETGWTEEMDQIFADIADREIAELIGMEVAGADGDVVGEVDNFALEGEDVVAIVGVGGFLGIGEHDVALPLGDMTYDGERLVLSSLTEDQLREMPEYESNEETQLPQDGTLRSTYNQ